MPTAADLELAQLRAQAQRELTVPLSAVTVGRQIGTGTYKNVHAAQYNGGAVAVLRQRSGRDALSAGAPQSGWPHEADALLSVGRHPCIIGLVGVADDCSSGRWIILQELAAHGPLDALLEQRSGRITPVHAMHMTEQIAFGLSAMAAAGWVHRDVAARNVLVCAFEADRPSACRLKLADLGSAVDLQGARHREVADCEHGDAAQEGPQQAGVPVRWAAPEVLRGRRYSEGSDVFAFGVCAWEVLSGGAMPWASTAADEEVEQAVCAGERLTQPAGCPDILWYEIRTCWAADLAARPCFASLRATIRVARCLVAEAASRSLPIPPLCAADVLEYAFFLQGTEGGGPVPDASLLWIASEALAVEVPEGVDDQMLEEDFKRRYRAQESVLAAKSWQQQERQLVQHERERARQPRPPSGTGDLDFESAIQQQQQRHPAPAPPSSAAAPSSSAATGGAGGSAAGEPGPGEWDLTLKRDQVATHLAPLGLELGLGSTAGEAGARGATIRRVHRGYAGAEAEARGLLAVGDLVTHVNGVRLPPDMSVADAHAVLQQAGPEVRLRLARRGPSPGATPPAPPSKQPSIADDLRTLWRSVSLAPAPASARALSTGAVTESGEAAAPAQPVRVLSDNAAGKGGGLLGRARRAVAGNRTSAAPATSATASNTAGAAVNSGAAVSSGAAPARPTAVGRPVATAPPAPPNSVKNRAPPVDLIDFGD